jgi:hypothetical protein
MRKLFWCCTLAVVAAGSLAITAYQTWLHPESVVIRCVGVMTQAAGAWRAVSLGVLSTTQAASQDRAVREMIPEDPRPVQETTATTVAHKAEVPPGPPPIVIPEEEPARTGADPKPDELVQGGEEKDQTPPPLMPLVGDEPADKASKPEQKSVFDAWLRFFTQQAAPSGQSEEADSVGPMSLPSCQEDSHYHEHYSGCPHTSCPASICPYTGKSVPSDTPELPPAVPEKNKTAPGKQAHKVLQHSAEKRSETAAHPDVDTMEYRPSDGPLNEFASGGPY